jgi:hypothetical protein
MVRRTRILLAFVTAVAAAVSGAALAPATGDDRITGSPAKLSYTEDGVPYVRSGPECKAGKTHGGKAHARPDASDY